MDELYLDNQSERYRLLFENSFEGMVIFQREGVILEVNQLISKLLDEKGASMQTYPNIQLGQEFESFE